MPHDKHQDEHEHGKATPHHDAEGKRRDDDDKLSSRKGNVTVGHTEGKAEGTRENVDASLHKQEREQKKHQ